MAMHRAGACPERIGGGNLAEARRFAVIVEEDSANVPSQPQRWLCQLGPEWRSRSVYRGFQFTEHRMHSFIAAGDDSESKNATDNWFVFGGFSASRETWESMVSEWGSNVLSTPPVVEALHVSSFYNPYWRDKNQMSWDQAKQKLDAAAAIIGKTKGLQPSTGALRGDLFDRFVAGRRFNVKEGKKPAKHVEFGKDYILLMHFIADQLRMVRHVDPGSAKVDFWIEQKTGFTSDLDEYRNRAVAFLKEAKLETLVPMLGVLQPHLKTQIQIQAADFLTWHERNAKRQLLGLDERRRFDKCIDGRAVMSRREITEEALAAMDRALTI